MVRQQYKVGKKDDKINANDIKIATIGPSNEQKQYEKTLKLILIGDSGVGKSCIIQRIGTNSYTKVHEVTIGAEFTTVAAHISKDVAVKIQVWDSCGQERFNSITRIFYRNA